MNINSVPLNKFLDEKNIGKRLNPSKIGQPNFVSDINHHKVDRLFRLFIIFKSSIFFNNNFDLHYSVLNFIFNLESSSKYMCVFVNFSFPYS